MVNGMANLIPMLFGKVEAVHLSCAAHCLNLIVQAVLAVAKGSIDAIRNFVNFVRRSSKQRQQLNAIARTVKEEAKHAGAKLQLVTIDLSANVDTRWNSCYTMLQSAIKLEVPIALYQSLVAGHTPEVVTAMASTLPSLAENTAIAPLLANLNTPVDNATAGNPAEGGSQQAEDDAESAKDSKKSQSFGRCSRSF
ncbi:Tam3-transposase (Ac family) [Plasmopara halstedii]|uniref:Tam3-transposase (Ac family) n=1 Tax=Plasmopara halstedii TaxID=4781 RepID=A0A0P1ACW8_PLAHL|nr:Tam3-transposase (Ac family) [Plasmopara halstedii]CEG38560.1 Tam3-transposase (Ac family) [Plasmopara halstedii]|eukprot:XP_024574929.1 Tam3-transposase (Ac family) [Plasmopara halstedii]